MVEAELKDALKIIELIDNVDATRMTERNGKVMFENFVIMTKPVYCSRKKMNKKIKQ